MDGFESIADCRHFPGGLDPRPRETLPINEVE